MKPEIENLKAWMSGKSTTGYQRALAMREFEQLLTYVAELEQLRQPPVSGRSEQFVCGANRVMGEKRCEKQCGQCEELYPQTNCH
jgi:hypothetical protein